MLIYIYDGDMEVHCIKLMTLSMLTVHMQTVTLNGFNSTFQTDKTPHITFTTALSLLFYDTCV